MASASRWRRKTWDVFWSNGGWELTARLLGFPGSHVYLTNFVVNGFCYYTIDILGTGVNWTVPQVLIATQGKHFPYGLAVEPDQPV